MIRQRWRRIGLLVALALSLAASAVAQGDPKTLEAALTRPISPGSVAMLVLHASSPAVVERLAQALAHENPEVRAVAARVAFETKHAG